ncbi:MAG TPA: glycosyltransferase family 9 protein [Holophagaceae bacterium]
MIPEGATWVRMPRFIGDALMIHQSLAPLRAAGRPLVAWGPAPVMDLFEGSGTYAATVADVGKPGTWALAGLLRRHRAAGVVNLPRSTRGLLAGFLARTPLRAGWSESGGRLLATCSQPFKGRNDHQADRYRDLLARAFPGLPPAEPPAFRPRAEAWAEAEALRVELGLEGPFVVLGLGAAAWVKRLGTPLWIDLIGWLRDQGLAHVLLGGTFFEDLAQADALRQAFPGIPDLCGKVPLPVSAALVAQAAAVVGNDSALAHLAAACHTPLVAAFGPTRPELTAPRGPRVTILRKEDLSCLGCLLLQCPVPGHPCMEALEPARLRAAVASALAPVAAP